MKKLIYAAAAAAIALGYSCSGGKGAAETASAEPADSSLIIRLQKLVDNGQVAFGHHDDLAYGYRWAYQPDSSDVKNVTGDYPAIVNWDLGLIEWGADKELDGVPFDFIRQHAAEHHQRGGINTFSWHPRNPVTKGNAWDTSCPNVIEQVLVEGSPLNDTIKAWIGNAADFIASIKDADGRNIPVVFRPWHEHTGDWFWWCQPYCTPEQFKALWRLTYDIFQQKGLDNVVWAYSPDKSNGQTMEEYMLCYPGDEYVDIMGADVYHFGGEDGNETFTTWMTNILGVATQAAAEHGKIVALTETGSETIPVPDWFTRVLWPAIKDYPVAYITVWRNAMPEMKHEHYYAPYAGHPAAPDFVKFYEMPETAFLQDIKEI